MSATTTESRIETTVSADAETVAGMSAVTSPSAVSAAPAVAEPPPPQYAPAKVIGPRADAALLVRRQVERGLDVRGLRIRYPEDLDKARAQKMQWTSETTELLMRLFDKSSVADYCNDWLGKIFPEYAEFGNFVDQFYEETDHRLARLRAVLKQLERTPETPAAARAVGASAAAVSDDHAATEDQSIVERAPEATAAPAASQPVTRPATAPVSSTTSSPTVREPRPSRPAAEAPSLARHANGNGGGDRRDKVLLIVQPGQDQQEQQIVDFVRRLELNVVTTRGSADGEAALLGLEGQQDLGFALVLIGSQGAGDVQASTKLAFQLGYCVGRIGFKRVAVVGQEGAAAAGSNAQQVAHLTLDAGGGWQLSLARQLKRGGMNVDLNKLA